MNSDDPVQETAPTGGVWVLAGGVPVAVERWDVGPATVLVPSEAVLMLAVDLPLSSRAQRLGALPFAVEDRLAEPLDAVHVAMGAEIAPRCHLAGIVRHAVMREWLAAIDTAGLGHAAIMPDALLLPTPPPGAWSIESTGGRTLVRTDAGTGFAVRDASFPGVWAAGGQLPCIVHGGPLPFDLPMSSRAEVVEAASPRLLSPPLDLRQGPYAAAARPLPKALRRLGLVLGLGLLAHTAIAAADTLKLQSEAGKRRVATEALLRQVLPGTPLTADIERLVPSGGAARGRFLPLLGRAAAALQPVGGLNFTRIAYADGDGALTLGIEAADIGGLQRAQAALAAAGLRPESGAATAGSGRADAEIVVRGAL